MRAIQQKLWRELWQMRGQALAIALVITGGVAVAVMSLSTYQSLLDSRDYFYREYQFAQLFVSLKRAPQQQLARLAQIPGVRQLQDRVVAPVNLTVPDFADPVTGLLQSVPAQESGSAPLNQLHLVRGRLPQGDREVVISDGFAEAHQLPLGEHLLAVINGRQQALKIVGVVLSPEHIYQIAPGAVMPDYQRFGVMWMARAGLAKAYDMDGAFNDLTLTLELGTNPQAVIQQVDWLLKPYGGFGAYGRNEQLSNRFLQEEFSQLQSMAVMFPTIFLSVAVFLLNVVINRLIAAQRELIGVLKAFGYSNRQVGWHYSQMVLLIAGLGLLSGIALGAWLGLGMTRMYTEYYRFPQLLYRAEPAMLLAISGGTLLVAWLGSMMAVRAAALLPPAEAMRPEPPATYRQTLLEKMGLQHWFSQPTRMILRHIERRPFKSLLAILGVAAACGIMMVGNFQTDAVSHMMHVQFSMAQKEDLNVTFVEPADGRAASSLLALPGVRYVEGQRSVPVQFRYRQYQYRGSVQGWSSERQLSELFDQQLRPLQLPKQGILLSEQLAKKLHVGVGDELLVQVLDGRRQQFRVSVAALSQQYMGVGAYMNKAALNRLLAEGDVMSNALLTVEPAQQAQVYRALRRMPMVAGIGIRQATIDSFENMLQQILLTFTLINTLLGGVIAFGVIYNTVRIALAERERELASLRVLGYSLAEIAYILLGELAILVLLGIPVGFVIGAALCALMVEGLQSDLFSLPLVLHSRTYAWSALVVLGSALISALIAWRRLQQLDLVEVLKTRE